MTGRRKQERGKRKEERGKRKEERGKLRGSRKNAEIYHIKYTKHCAQF